jgi:hypothetical protein
MLSYLRNRLITRIVDHKMRYVLSLAQVPLLLAGLTPVDRAVRALVAVRQAGPRACTGAGACLSRLRGGRRLSLGLDCWSAKRPLIKMGQSFVNERIEISSDAIM